MRKLLKKLMRDERGVSALEYAILAAAIIVAVSVAVTKLGLGDIFEGIGQKVSNVVEEPPTDSDPD